MGKVDVARQGYFSLVRWRSNITRDEARNVAVLLVDSTGHRGVMRASPVSALSPKLKDQGLIDALLVGLDARLAEASVGPELLDELHSSLNRSLVVTERQPVALTEMDSTLSDLYRAYVARPGGPKVLTKGVVLDRVVQILRAQGNRVDRGAELGDFLFDAVIRQPGHKVAVEVLSFAGARKDWTPIYHDAGHFLYALSQEDVPGTAVISPPTDMSGANAFESFKRIQHWLRDAHVPVRMLDEMKPEQSVLP